jgi:parvulin-like peptidyl-prolyl isomerase
MKRRTIAALFALTCGLSGCSAFTAGEAVSEPDLTLARATRATADAKQPKNHQAEHGDHGHGDHAEPAHKHDPHGDVHAAKQAPAVAEVKEQVTASHILIAYAGARAASDATKRTKEQAQKLAEEVAAKAHARGADFAALAKRYTEDPSGKTNGGKLGSFERGRLVKPFEDAVFALPPGQVSGVVETAFGFHIIHREK